MTVQLSPEQERAIQEAINSGLFRSIDEFIETAIAMLPSPKNPGQSSRNEAIRRMEEFGKKYHLSLGGTCHS
ncbi:MAG TPA: hypothetical protein VHA33_07925 [Candidatus Angelobacter sp.]|jgi:Arc/MetJ-type ribon-helix-helix transcriptional regulator|nr:hypothetical protein [Candidatus Angelobacter sp.]